ncbi:Clp protease N-terminal domain-containing protein [Saccharothrix longispora]|uniref:Clp protease N-terminal domain-containing protein n=1 Tax=Saccharothrix longispora TaxID=33920 RepID=UPI0028FD903F|nr:Clp protease N-terminal domain-containing protein [Saccharothrix longispora]MBY8847270.1 type II toxin-antitoxin system CcdA family antitoxin [Saccharothrix sp. MB29]MDU0293210.1 Clp protease N-terminal domain-containing protein [Saccharothrix longispora]
MPKINVYLPDELAEQVKDVGVPVSAVCQRALEQAVKRIAAVRAVRLDDPDSLELAARTSRVTDRVRAVLRLATERARAAGAAEVGTGHLLGGVLDEGGNLAVRVLQVLEVEPGRVAAALPAGTGGGAVPTAFGADAAAALELSVVEAVTLGHNYVGCEHLLLGVLAEPDGAGGEVLRGLGVEPRAARNAVAAALAGYAHLHANAAAAPDPTAVVAAVVQRELRPLVERLERLERG